MLLMRIRKPSPEVVEAVKAAVAWLDKVKIMGKKSVFIQLPEGLEEDRSIKRDRVLVDDPKAKGLWARYYDLETNRAFFSDRTGRVNYDMRDIPAECRVSHGRYGMWRQKVLKKYPERLLKQR